MNCVPAQLPGSIRCRVATSLTAIEIAKLRVMCGEVPAAQTLLSCEIAAGHDGSHVAFAATADDGELWWWLYWGGQTRDVRQVDLCDGRRLDDPYLDDCLLPDGHQGPHSFDLPVG
jgi:hypothetical protein